MDHSNSGLSALELQRRIYVRGLSGKTPDVPLSYEELKSAAGEKLSRPAFDYLAGGAGREETMIDNREAFRSVHLLPRMMRNVADYSLDTELFGSNLPAPLLLAPIGVLELAHNEADLAVCRAASELEIPVTFSNQASVAMERCTAEMGDSPRWFQLYWSKSDDLTKSLIRRAEKCGCSALVVTLDTTLLGWRRRDLKGGYLPFLEGKGLAQYISDPVFQELVDQSPEDSKGMSTSSRSINFSLIRSLYRLMRDYPGSFWDNIRTKRPMKAVRTFIDMYSRPNLEWEDLERLRRWTDLPILLKGIQHPDDALEAVERGADGIWISNHGGRQVDGATASLDALRKVRKVLDQKVPVVLDSGIRSGADMFKALALGADAIALGRPYAFALAVGGESGVRSWLEYFTAEFELNMRLSGCRSIQEISPEMLD